MWCRSPAKDRPSRWSSRKPRLFRRPTPAGESSIIPRGFAVVGGHVAPVPIDFRYGRPKMKGIFEEESRLQRLLEVEAALARAEAKVGLIPEPAAAEITKKATTKQVTVKRFQEIEEETRHDLMAFVYALTESC